MADNKAKVLMCMDGSKYADHALDWYLQYLAKPQDELILLNCVEINFGSNMPKGTGGSEVITRLIEEHKLEAEHYVKALAEKMKQKQLHGTFKQVYGPPRTEILRVAEEENVTAIVTGTHGMGKVKRTMIGSVSDHVLHHSKMPVIICRHEDDHKHLH